MKRILALAVVLGALPALAQYDDYPAASFEFKPNRVSVSPARLIGGMDPSQRDQGPKVDMVWTPGLDFQELRYERVLGVQGTYGVGPIFNLYLGTDSVQATGWAAGVFGRVYAGVASGSFLQMALQYYGQSGTKIRDGGNYVRLDVPDSLVHDPVSVTVSGPQVSPSIGYQKILGRHWILEGLAGITLGWYHVKVDAPGDSVVTRVWDTFAGVTTAEELIYRTGTNWGGFFHAQISLGYAW